MLSRMLVLLPLIVAFGVIARKVSKAYKATPYGPDEKEIVRDAWKGIAYVCAAAVPAGFLPSLGVVGVVFGTLISVVLSVLIVLCVVDLPDRLSWVHNLAWREWRKTPGYSKTDEPVEYARWARRAAMLLFLLFVFVAALVGGDADVQASGSNTVVITPTASSATSTSPSKIPAASPTASASPPASAAGTSSQYVDNNCDGPKKIPTVVPVTKDFYTGNLVICYNGSWKTWSQVTDNAPPPSTVRLIAWVAEGSYGYGRIDAQGRQYTVRTTDF